MCVFYISVQQNIIRNIRSVSETEQFFLSSHYLHSYHHLYHNYTLLLLLLLLLIFFILQVIEPTWV